MWIISPDNECIVNSKNIVYIKRFRCSIDIKVNADLIKIEFHSENKCVEYFNSVIKGLEQEACK